MSVQIPEEVSTFKDIEMMGYDYSGTVTTHSPVQINYKFHDKSRPADLASITIPHELFEGPAQACLPLFLQDLREEFSYMDASARQLELWVVSTTVGRLPVIHHSLLMINFRLAAKFSSQHERHDEQ